MPRYFFITLTVIFLIHPLSARPQETGCFKVNTTHGLEFESNIDFSRYNAFFVGELHGVYGTIDLKLALIKYLNTHYGVTDVFMEISYSSAWLYNQYLATGDTALFTKPSLVYAMKQANRDFWKNLYAYNNAAAYKLTIHGMDFERMDFLKALKLLMPPGKEKPYQVSALLTYIDTATILDVNDGIRNKDKRGLVMPTLYDSIRKSIENNQYVYEQYYGANFKIVARIMHNENTYSKYAYRNKTMYDNMIEQIKEDGIKKFVMFNGLMHGNRSYAEGRSLCYQLSVNKAFRNKLVDISMVCKNCYDWQMTPQGTAAFHAPYTYQNDTSLLNNIFENHFNPDCKYTLAPTKMIGDKRVKKFSHYLILMKDEPEF